MGDWGNTILGNVKGVLIGTYRDLSKKHVS